MWNGRSHLKFVYREWRTQRLEPRNGKKWRQLKAYYSSIINNIVHIVILMFRIDDTLNLCWSIQINFYIYGCFCVNAVDIGFVPMMIWGLCVVVLFFVLCLFVLFFISLCSRFAHLAYSWTEFKNRVRLIKMIHRYAYIHDVMKRNK